MKNKLDREYFNSIELQPIDNRYYDLKKVDELLVDIRARALETNALNRMLLEEIVDLRNRLSEKESKGSVRYTAIKTKPSQNEATEATRKLCAQMIEDAKLQADKIVSDSKIKASMISNTKASNESSNLQKEVEEEFIMKMADAFESIKLKNPDDAQYINEQWQNFLIRLFSDNAPKDMNDRVKNIADVLSEIES